MRHLSLNLLFILLLLSPTWVWGLPDDREKPIQLEADRAQLDQNTGTSLYEGNVVITQGSMRLTANTVTVYTEGGVFERMEAIGNPVTLRYKPTMDKPEIQGVSQQVDYNAATAQVVMRNNAKITQGQDVFRGDRIEYDLKENLVRARSNKGRRIQFTIQPRQSKKP